MFIEAKDSAQMVDNGQPKPRDSHKVFINQTKTPLSQGPYIDCGMHRHDKPDYNINSTMAKHNAI